jgi:uncharacterized membrane protein YhaH (DUF805 family)
VEGPLIAEFKALFRLDGRRSRRGYWRAYLWLTALSSVVLVAGYWTMIHVRWLGVALLSPMLAMIGAQVAVIVQRLHDRARSGLWAAPFLLLSLVGSFVQNPTGSAILILLLNLGLLWGVVEIAFLRGRRGANRYGPDPHGTRTGYLGPHG